MENLEPADLDAQMNMGIVCTGKIRNLTALRADLKKMFGVNVVFNTLSSEYLFIVKKSALSSEQQEMFKQKIKEK